MIKIDAIPLKEINGIKFGVKREEVRQKLGKYKEFKKWSMSKVTTDDFGYCHVYYNEKQEFEAIEIFDDAQVFINGKLIFPIEFDSANKIIDDFQIESDSLISKSQSIGIFAPDKKMETILFGVKGYYDN